MSTINTVLFDLDGTLVDSALDFHGCLNKLLENRRKPPVELEKVKQVASNGSAAMLECAFSSKPEPELQNEFLDLYYENIDRKTKPFEGILELLDELDAHYIQWGVVTNKAEHLTLTLLARLQLLNRCSVVVCGDTLEHKKPHPAPLLHACEKLNVTPEQCIFVGDSKVDIDAGAAAGIETVLALFGYADQKNYKSFKANHCVNNAEELSKYLLSKAMTSLNAVSG